MLDAGKADHARIGLMDSDEPPMKRTIVEWVAAAFTAHMWAGKEAAEERKEACFVLHRADLGELVVGRSIHAFTLLQMPSAFMSRWDVLKDSDRAMSCLSSAMATLRQEGCALRFSSAGVPASGHTSRG